MMGMYDSWSLNSCATMEVMRSAARERRLLVAGAGSAVATPLEGSLHERIAIEW